MGRAGEAEYLGSPAQVPEEASWGEDGREETVRRQALTGNGCWLLVPRTELCVPAMAGGSWCYVISGLLIPLGAE